MATTVASSQTQSVTGRWSCSSELSLALDKTLQSTILFLETWPEYRDLTKELSFQVRVESGPAVAKTDLNKQLIILNPDLFDLEVKGLYPLALETLLFELYNLSQREKFLDLINSVSQFTPNEFVEKFEGIEYQSGLKTKEVLRKHLPKEEWGGYSRTRLVDDFRLNYLIQQVYGHSMEIWKNYSYLFRPGCMYKESWNPSLLVQEKSIIKDLLVNYSYNYESDSIAASQKKVNYEILKSKILEKSDQGHALFWRLKQRLPVVENSS